MHVLFDDTRELRYTLNYEIEKLNIFRNQDRGRDSVFESFSVMIIVGMETVAVTNPVAGVTVVVIGTVAAGLLELSPRWLSL